MMRRRWAQAQMANKPYDVEQLRAIGTSAVAQAAGIAHVPTHQLLALLDDLKAAQEALKFYGDIRNWDYTDPHAKRQFPAYAVEADAGDRARKALEGVKS